mmetsp:Transcript_123004/g.307190  ORF Transcript_123004/g.307190 Transcript_123004/m.307190 type:complete len:208 (-) Transcript_123004:1475-2098(-)
MARQQVCPCRTQTCGSPVQLQAQPEGATRGYRVDRGAHNLQHVAQLAGQHAQHLLDLLVAVTGQKGRELVQHRTDGVLVHPRPCSQYHVLFHPLRHFLDGATDVAPEPGWTRALEGPPEASEDGQQLLVDVRHRARRQQRVRVHQVAEDLLQQRRQRPLLQQRRGELRRRADAALLHGEVAHLSLGGAPRGEARALVALLAALLGRL